MHQRGPLTKLTSEPYAPRDASSEGVDKPLPRIFFRAALKVLMAFSTMFIIGEWGGSIRTIWASRKIPSVGARLCADALSQMKAASS